MQAWGAALATILFAAPCLGWAAAACDPDLIPAGGANRYKERAPGLCEGLYASRVGAPPLQLVSLTDGTLPATARPLDLTVAAPSEIGAVRLRGTGVPNGLFYRLDAEVTSGGSVHWAANEVLGAAGIPLADIGLFAYRPDETGTPVYLPVDVGGNATAARTAELRAAALVEDLRWRFVPAGGSHGSVEWTHVDADSDRLRIELPPGAGLLEIGWSDQQSGQPQMESFRIGG